MILHQLGRLRKTGTLGRRKIRTKLLDVPEQSTTRKPSPIIGHISRTMRMKSIADGYRMKLIGSIMTMSAVEAMLVVIGDRCETQYLAT